MAALRRLLEKDVSQKLLQYEAASQQEVHELGELFARQLQKELPHGISNPHRLFKHMDVDQSGRITLNEVYASIYLASMCT